ncbi:pleckstrin homology domain-containing family M member 1-like isoform X2 [Littorina saxatilis]|uniref:pleckstrin homology domain-containing family M member 1-like isoform X2 n=1 Tax=Littorina saxatilis TaxID=31220 RepID=UPI0038B4DAD2
MFRKKAYENVSEGLIHKEERDRLTHHFHRSLKCLQQKEHIDGATIFSNEASNNLCNVLEAVFLHGAKDNVVAKLVSYAQGIQGTNNEVKTNFWNVVKKFTHQDVIIQLKQLSQITSEIGYCRAWVRLAINDGLMASYLASMTADMKALRTFYHTWAYLLDYEQPEILRNHLTGLMNLHFNLSSNSNILNKWSSTTLEFAGLLLETQALNPVIRPGTPSPPSSRRESVDSLTSMDSIGGTNSSITTTTTINTTTTFLIPPAHTAHVYTINTPPNTPAGSLPFNNHHDMEALKKLAGVFRSSSNSSTSSSAASCPDPSEPCRTLDGRHSGRSSGSGSPTEKRRISRCKSPGHRSRSKSPRRDSLVQNLRPDSKNNSLQTDSQRKRLHDRLDAYTPQTDSQTDSQRKSLYNRPDSDSRISDSRPNSMIFLTRQDRQFDEQMKLKSILARLDQKEQERSEREDQESLQEDERRKQELYAKIARGREDKREHEKRELAEAEEKFRQSWEKRGSKSAEKMAEKVRERCEDNSFRKETTEAQVRKGEETLQKRRESAEKENLSGMEGERQKSQGRDSQSSPGELLVERLQEAMDTCDGNKDKASAQPQREEEREEGETEMWSQRGSSYGNSLTAMDGWTTASPIHRHAALEQSYETLLRGYHAEQADSTRIVSVQEVLHNLPQLSSHTSGREKRSEPFEAVDVEGKVEQLKSLCQFVGKNNQQQTCATPTCQVGVGYFHGPGMLDEFDGKTYCQQCHLNQVAYIPAEIVFNWNFNKMKVCAGNFNFLQRVQDQPVLEIDEMYPSIYDNVPAINFISLLRTRLTSLRSYMFTCSESTARQLRDKVWPREHLYNKVHSYSVNDLLEVRSGKLETFLKEVVSLCTKHVYTCRLCLAKGFYCELCQDPTPIYPFEVETTVKCKSCKNVYHTRCKTNTIACPKCTRYTQRGMHKNTDGDDDYACSPI